MRSNELLLFEHWQHIIDERDPEDLVLLRSVISSMLSRNSKFTNAFSNGISKLCSQTSTATDSKNYLNSVKELLIANNYGGMIQQDLSNFPQSKDDIDEIVAMLTDKLERIGHG